VFSLDLGLLLAGTKERGELEKRVNTVISEAQNAGEGQTHVVKAHWTPNWNAQ